MYYFIFYRIHKQGARASFEMNHSEHLTPDEFDAVYALNSLATHGDMGTVETEMIPWREYQERVIAKRPGHKEYRESNPGGKIRHLPHTVYVLFSIDEQSIYVGRSMCPFIRWVEHDLNRGSKASFGRGPWRTATHFNCEDQKEARRIETFLHASANEARRLVEVAFDREKGSLTHVFVCESDGKKLQCGELLVLANKIWATKNDELTDCDEWLLDDILFAQRRVRRKLRQIRRSVDEFKTIVTIN